MKRVTMGHGAGGEMMQELLAKHILPFLPKVPMEVPLQAFDDSAVVDGTVFTIDGHTVKPLFFPGGDIGTLSVYGTVNDISVMGAKPIALAVSLVLEEGLEFEVLERVAKSIGEASAIAGVPIVTGDTKVMEAGKLERMVVSTAAIGQRSEFLDHDLEVASQYRKVDSRWMTDDNLRDGDAVIATGTLGDHGIALLSFREGYGFESQVQSDCAPMNGLAADILKVGGAVCMKDPTRGGLANAVNEWASKSKVGIEVEEQSVPIAEPVRNACEMLGLDPLTIGNEGKMIVGVVHDMAEQVLDAIRRHPLGRNAAIIGRADKNLKGVVLRTEVGGRRILEPPVGDPVPRIC
ncbi:MAG TPA: hydrogenase expression/formation protein HypE [Methanomassiliicoccales archaeon]|nr:hydrogenase expression/formation protein HypE [Methanomassiliicoccales archaeon]